MRYRVSELSGALLDAAVALAEGYLPVLMQYGENVVCWVNPRGVKILYRPSREWSEGGPIIERELITVIARKDETNRWYAQVENDNPAAFADGSAPLVAAMRAYVADKFGDAIELPEVSHVPA